MSYTLKLTNGRILVTLPDQQSDNVTTSLTLIGKNVNAYGTDLNDNFVRLLENFASPSAPTSPLIGQIWFKTTEQRMYVYNASNEFKPVGGPIVASTQPQGLVAGDLWIDTTARQLKFYDGANLIAAGPQYDYSKGKAGWVVETIKDSSNADRTVVSLYANGTLLGILSNTAFSVGVLSSTSTGISSVGVGFTSTPSAKFIGTATNADAIGGINAADILTSVKDNATTGTFGIFNDVGLTIGTDEDFQFYVTGTTRVATLALAAQQDFDFIVQTPTNPSEHMLYYSSATGYLGVFTATPEASLDVNGDVRITGNLSVIGTSTYIDSTDLRINDKQIELAYTSDDSVTDTLADGGGFILHGSTNKELLWRNSGGAWNSSENFNLAASKVFRIGGSDVLSANALGISVVAAPGLTSVGNLNGVVAGQVQIQSNTIGVTNSIPLVIGTGLTTNIDANGKKITNLATAVITDSGSVAANKAYVDSAVAVARSGQFGLTLDVTGQATSAEDPSLDNYVISMLNYLYPINDPPPYGIAEAARARVMVTRYATTPTFAVSNSIGFTAVPVYQAGTTSTVSVVEYASDYVASLTVPANNLTINKAVKQYIVSGGVWARYNYIGSSNTVYNDGSW
jgi:hypothetical protein